MLVDFHQSIILALCLSERKTSLALLLLCTHRQQEVRCAGQMLLTTIAVVVHQDYLFEKVGGCPLDGRVNRPQDDGQGFIHKNEHNAHLREV